MKILDKILNGTFIYYGILSIILATACYYTNNQSLYYIPFGTFALTAISTVYSIFKSK